MGPGPFLRRELTTSLRSSRAFADRRYSAWLVSAVIVACFTVWDWQGWDRSSVAGSHRFSLLAFAAVIVAMTLLAFGLVVPHVAQVIASERDRKTLDALLASRFSSAEIVLGAIETGLFRYANASLGLIPLLVLIVYLGGVPTDWLILAALGLFSMAFALAAVSVLASVGSKTAVKSVNLAGSLVMLWGIVPALFIMLRPAIWPGAPSWLVSLAIMMVDGSPLGLVINLGGIVPRPGGLIGAVGRLMAWELIGGLVLVVWAIVRLRPASRGLYDVEGEATRIKRLRAAMRRPPRRPPCFDDPVFWYEIHSTLGQTIFRRRISQTITMVALGFLAWLTWYFARPAFDELVERGYGPSREALQMPDLEPIARFLVSKLSRNFSISVAPGQARLEFNIVLRQFSSLCAMGLFVMAYQCGFESVKGEQKRDTWLGLIATPLTAREILRGKMLGSLWKARGTLLILLVLWLAGLATGAIHPLGFVVGITLLAVTSPFFAALGLSMALDASNPERPPRSLDTSPLNLAFYMGSIMVLGLGPFLLAWASLFTYEDVQAAIQGGPFPRFRDTRLSGILGARSVVVIWLIGTAVLAWGAVWRIRDNARWFDRAIGRPMRPESRVAVSAPAEGRLEVAPGS